MRNDDAADRDRGSGRDRSSSSGSSKEQKQGSATWRFISPSALDYSLLKISAADTAAEACLFIYDYKRLRGRNSNIRPNISTKGGGATKKERA